MLNIRNINLYTDIVLGQFKQKLYYELQLKEEKDTTAKTDSLNQTTERDEDIQVEIKSDLSCLSIRHS